MFYVAGPADIFQPLTMTIIVLKSLERLAKIGIYISGMVSDSLYRYTYQTELTFAINASF